MARWEVVAITEEVADVADVEDDQDTRCFFLDHLERVSGGTEAVVGHTWVEEGDVPVADNTAWGADESYEDDPYDNLDTEVELPSLFDDPIRLQNEEDEEDPDAPDAEADVA